MQFKKERLKTLETIAFMLAVAAESVLGRWYFSAGGDSLSGFFGAANRSVWEQMKVLFFSYAAASLPVLAFSGVGFRRVFTAKAAASVALVLSYAAYYYTYSGASGGDFAVANDCGILAATLFAFFLSYRLAVSGKGRAAAFLASVLLWSSLLAAFCSLTLRPLELPLFRDPVSGAYGLNAGGSRAVAGAVYTWAAPQKTDSPAGPAQGTGG